jgi:hypothetical protein
MRRVSTHSNVGPGLRDFLLLPALATVIPAPDDATIYWDYPFQRYI